MRSLNGWWQRFTHNFCWSDYVPYIDGWIPKLALSVPIIAYLILFNDKISELLSFTELANEENLAIGLSGVQRLRFLYFGLICLGVSNLIYRLKKPYQFRFGTNLVEFTRTCLEVFTLSHYIQINDEIRHEGHLTLTGKYDDYEWDSFLKAATNTETTFIGSQNKWDGNWEIAKSQYGGLLRNILAEHFFRYDTGKRFWLSLCLVLSTVGYILMLAPSVDIFIKVCLSTFGSSL